MAKIVHETLFGDRPNQKLTEAEKDQIRDIANLAAGLVGGVTGGGAGAVTGAVASDNAVVNNALSNASGENKLNDKEKQLNKKLKAAGVQSADDYQQRYDECKTDACRQQVNADYRYAAELADRITLAMYNSGQLTADEFKILVTSYANKMMQGAGDSEQASNTGGEIYTQNGATWSPAGVINNPYFDEINTRVLLSDLKSEGASDEQIANRLQQNQIARDYLFSLPPQEQVALLLAEGFAIQTVLNVVTKVKGGAVLTDKAAAGKGDKTTSGAENVATYPKLKDELMQQNLNNIAKQDSRLAAAAKGSGTTNPNFSVGMGTADEANRLGKIWVGDGARLVDNQKNCPGCWISADGSRLYRPPTEKANTPTHFNPTGIQANFQILEVNPTTGKSVTISNGHMSINK
ncbi:VENN motif pre-toxin domain-containing protein [Stenoxybacter acetivorans]|uniref:VENN motif pre-toxin domain-containing protein n=1 Tax=Stenoxybacter acetivorans TaxID=422441 RepID=UPI001470396B|nr:VENN motif pre-toxin domain-containing protein [Stenoxybacter acetivorans]